MKYKASREKYVFSIFIAGKTPHSRLAVENVKAFCEQFLLAGQYNIEVIDIAIHPDMAERYDIIVIPTILKLKPEPTQTIVGDFSDRELIKMRLGIK